MKKTVSKILVVLLLMTAVLGLVACGGSESQFVGTWNATEIEAYGVTMAPEDAGLTFSITFEKDGKVTALTNGEADGEGTWEEDGDTVTITSNGETMSGTLEDGVLTLDISGIVFKLEKE
ncbi:MAG: hypothetical protein K6B12_03765 [Clostridiales bacterium]|nr:hypothetical protein [Clostridiales bacterium]